MTALTIPTRHARSAGRERPADWYAVSVPTLAPAPPRDTFMTVSMALAAPVTERSRACTDAVLVDLARAARADHLAPTATDPDAAVHRLAARILSRFVHDPDHPALVAAAARLGRG